MNFRHEPGNHDDLPAIRHRAVHQIGQGVQFGRRYLRNASGIVVPDVPACQLRQPQQLRQYVGDGYAALGQLRVAIPDELPVYPHGLRLKVDPLHNIGEFRKVEAFGLCGPEGDAVQALREFALHGSLHHRRVSAEAHHIEVAVPELIEGIPVDGRVAELVLREHINGLVRDHRTGQQQAVFRLGCQAMHSLARRDVVGFDLMPLIADDHVGPPLGQFLLHAPRGFVVDHQYLQALACHVPDCVGLAGRRTLQDGQAVIVSGKLVEFVPPHAEDGKRSHNQEPGNPALLPKLADDPDGCERLARTHFHE